MARSGSLRLGALALTAAGALVVSLGVPAMARTASHQAAPTTCATLGAGSRGDAVATIQHRIGVAADGDFGPRTTAALKKWQKAHHVPATGVVDAATWAALPAKAARNACGQPVSGGGVAASCATVGPGARGIAVTVLQKALHLRVDGQDGPQTTGALVKAQRAAKLPATGATSAVTWKALHKTGTPVCIIGSTPGAPTATPTPAPTPPPPADAAAQAKIAAHVTQLAAVLTQKPGVTTNKLALAAMAFALHQIGKPYKYGGVGPSSYDCSGLAMTSYAHAALMIPRVAAAQYLSGGTKVSLDQAVQGDLLFYASDLTKPATVYHVVMYVGNGNVISAPETGETVKVQPLWTAGLLPYAVRPVTSVTLPLRPGATGPTVTQLQQALNRHGAKLTVDGGYGPAVEAAVRAWQARKQLPATGVADVDTWLSLG